MADFVTKFTAKEDEDKGPAPWTIWMDSLSNQHTEGVGGVLRSPEGDLTECAVHLQFPTTNNEAEYMAVLTGLDLAKAARASLVVIHSDSQVIIRHINGDYTAKGEQMKEYLILVKERVNHKFLAKFVQIPREENEQANCLAKATSVKHMAISS